MRGEDFGRWSGNPVNVREHVPGEAVGAQPLLTVRCSMRFSLVVTTIRCTKMPGVWMWSGSSEPSGTSSSTSAIVTAPQGTLAERMRAGGAGIPAFFTKTGVGTVVAEGKPHMEFDGETYVLERGIRADLALVKAWRADAAGNLVFRKTARNFNPMAATCGRVTVAEVEELVPVGSIDPDQVHTPGIFVQRVVVTVPEKRIEQRTVSPG